MTLLCVAVGAVMAEESPVQTITGGTLISGAVDTSVQWKPGAGSTMATRGANTPPSHYNGFNLEFVELRLEKPLDDAGWSAGYKVEMWFGQDADWLPGSLSSGVAVKQAYVSLRAPLGNGLEIRVGQFDAIIGYELLAPYLNPNFSRSLGNWIEPFSHTGALALYEVFPGMKITAGVADSALGVMNTKQPWAFFPTYGAGTLPQGPFPKGDGNLASMGLVTLTAPESWGWVAGGTLSGGVVSGGTDRSETPLNLYAGITVPTPLKCVSVGVSYDHASNTSDDAVYQGTWAQAVAGYTSWQITQRLKWNTRVEFANSGGSPMGFWINPLPGEVDGYVIGSPEELFALTGTLEFALWANVLSRLEVLWDHDLRNDGAFNGNNNAVLLLAEIAYRF